jgi:hypothetical protein
MLYEGSKSISSDEEPCPICEQEEHTAEEERKKKEKEKEKEKRFLSQIELFEEKKEKLKPGMYYIIQDIWVNTWNLYMKETDLERPQCIVNKDLLCEHGGFKSEKRKRKK